MKQKIKTPEAAQLLGQATNIKLLKKMIIGGFKEPQKFLYNTAFAFGEEKIPFMFIADSIPSAWKLYVKKNKLEKTFVAGSCALDEDGNLKLVIEVGKGGKTPVLTLINKLLLKKCKCKAYFVESLDSSIPAKDPSKKDKKDDLIEDLETLNLDLLVSEFKTHNQEGIELIKEFSSLINTLGKPLNNLKATIVTDDLIAKTEKGLKLIENSNHKLYITNAEALLKTVDAATLAKSTDLKKAFDALQKTLKEFNNLTPHLNKIQTVGAQVSLAKNPIKGDFPPISDEPFDTFSNKLKSSNSSSFLNKIYADLVKSS